MSEWEHLASWWMQEVAGDPAYAGEVLPLVAELAGPLAGRTVLDVGCGEGRLLRWIAESGGVGFGCDINASLAAAAAQTAPSFVCRLPSIPMRDAGVDTAVVVLVLEHLLEPEAFFADLHRVTRNTLIVVHNHPYFTAPGSSPIVDPTDGEVFWRPGAYLERGATWEPTAGGDVEFRHVPVGQLLTAAAFAGWHLEEMREQSVESGRDAAYLGQEHIPRLAGYRWGRHD